MVDLTKMSDEEILEYTESLTNEEFAALDEESQGILESYFHSEDEDLNEASALETLKPNGGSGGGESKAETLATFTSLLAQLGKEDLSDLFNQVQAQFGPNGAPGAEDKSASNAATLNMKPSAAVGTGAWKEDVDAMFSNDDLSEEFREKASVVFEAALNTKTNLEIVRLEEALAEHIEELDEKFEAALAEETANIFEDLTNKIDQYLDYTVQSWMEENTLAVENGLRAEIAEDFISGLHNLFSEHYITVPEEKLDIVAEMKTELEEVHAKLNEAIDENIELSTMIAEATKEATLDEICEGLADTQAEKLKSLSEGIDYTDAATYRHKIEIIKENYFGKKSSTRSTGLITEEIDGTENLNEEARYTAPGMDQYVKAISKIVK